MKQKILILLCLIAILWNLFLHQNVEASEATFDSGRVIVSGGYNSYDEIRNQSRQESKELEKTLTSKGYVLISGRHQKINEEDVKMLTENSFTYFWFTSYLKQSGEDDKYHVYVYQDSLKDYLNAVQDDTFEPFQLYGLDAELSYGAVVIDYHYWDSVEAVGSYSTEWGEAIADNPYAGYLYVSTPIDVVITFESTTKKVYYEIPFSSENPKPVKMLDDTYIIKNVNWLSVDSYEETIPFKNYIRISETYSQPDNPYFLSLYEFANKYDMIEIEDTERKPIAEPWNLQKETAIVEEPEETPKSLLWVWILAGFLGAVFSGIILRIYLNNRKKEQK